MNDHVLSYVDSTRSKEYSEVKDEIFLSDVLNENTRDRKFSDNFYWRKFRIKNGTDSTQTVAVNSRRFLINTAYIHSADRIVDTIVYGPRVPQDEWDVEHSTSSFALDVPPDTTYTILIHSRRPHTLTMSLQLLLVNPDWLQRRAYNSLYDNKELLYIQIGFISILFFLICFTVFQYFQHKDISYLHYSGYLLAMFIYFLNRHEASVFINIFFSYHPRFINYYSGSEPSLIAQFVFIFYLLFTNSFLDLKHTFPKLRIVIIRLVQGIIIIYIVQLLMYIIDVKPSFAYLFNEVFRGILNVIFLAFLVIIYSKIKTKPVVYFLIGSSALIIGSIISNYWNVLKLPPMRDAIIWTQAGTLIECLFFSAGLGYKTKLVLDEKNRTQKELILKLEENKKLQEQLNENLRNEVDIKNKERLMVDYENQILMLESELLSSQMNPHFIFNSLNSIKYYALTKPPVETAKFVTSFAKLMRIILNNSRRKTISIKEEIEFLDTYLAVELKRFDKKFSYEIFVDNIIDQDMTVIPPMILQPHIENALWHGLLHKEEAGKISISVTQNHEAVTFVIEDNGVGRLASRNLKNQRKKHKPASHGTAITSNRLQLMNDIYKINATIKVEDLFDIEELPCGTRITLQIPHIL